MNNKTMWSPGEKLICGNICEQYTYSTCATFEESTSLNMCNVHVCVTFGNGIK